MASVSPVRAYQAAGTSPGTSPAPLPRVASSTTCSAWPATCWPWFLATLAWCARHWPDAGHLATAGFVAAALVLAGVLTLSPESRLGGVSQRVIEASVLVWALLCGVYLRRRAAAGA